MWLVMGFLSGWAGGCSARESNNGEEPLRPAPGQAVVEVEGVEYGGQLAVMESFPVQLAASVTLTNRGEKPRTLTFPDGCLVLLRAYRNGDAAWDQASSVGCTLAIEEVTLAPGESRRLGGRATAYDVLGKDLPDGLYQIVAYLRPDGGEVEVPLGETDLAVPRR